MSSSILGFLFGVCSAGVVVAEASAAVRFEGAGCDRYNMYIIMNLIMNYSVIYY